MIEHQISNSRGNHNYNAYIYQNAVFHSHFHKNYELIYVIEGKTTVPVNGQSFTLSAGELLLVPPFFVHCIDVSDSVVWVGVFSEDYVAEFSSAHTGKLYSKFRCGEREEAFLKEHLFIRTKPDLYMLKSCLYLVCAECVKNSECINSERDMNFSERVVKYVSENLNAEFTMHSLAKEQNYEYHYFSLLFHRCFAMNFSDFINSIRFEHACTMLKNSNSPVTVISDECGFGSLRNFNRIFKKYSGQTPSEFRKGTGDVKKVQTAKR